MADEVVGTAPSGTETATAVSESPATVGSGSGEVTATDVAAIAGTLGQGTGQETTQSQAPAVRPSGNIPLTRHTQILANARKKAEAEAEARFRQTYGVPADVKPDVVKYALGIADWLGRDPDAMIAAVQQQLGRHPGQTPKQAAEAVVEKFEAALRSEDGKSVYTAEQVDQLWERRAAELEKKIRADYDPLRQEAQQTKQKQHIDAQVSKVLAHYRQQPHFRELEPEMKPLIEKGFSLVEAYNHLLITKVLPSVTTQSQQQTDASQQLARKANAQGVGAARDPVSGKFMKPTEMETIDVVRQVAREMSGRP